MKYTSEIMRATLVFALALAAGLVSPSASAVETGETWYRVEIIVLTHEGGQQDAYPVVDIDDFRALNDPLDRAIAAATRPRDEDESEDENRENADGPADDSVGGRAAEDPREALETIAAIAALENPEPAETGSEPYEVGLIWPQEYVNLPRLSPDMRAAWERLENSGQFRPRAWRAWYQLIGREIMSEPVRIHDRQILRGDWLRELDSVPAGSLPEAAPPRPADREADWRPEPEFRLDGSIRIYQTQFMHAASNIAWREPLEPDRRPLAPDFLEPGLFRQHRLEQSRAIRPGRFEYFDSSWLGALVLVTPMEGDEGPPDSSDRP